MPASNQLFLADHQQASAYARNGAPVPAQLVDFGEVSDLELEVLAELAAKAVHVTGIEYELDMVDVDLDQLLVIPDPVTEVFAELTEVEDPEALKELAASWARAEEFDGSVELAERLLSRVVELAATAVSADPDATVALYFLIGSA